MAFIDIILTGTIVAKDIMISISCTQKVMLETWNYVDHENDFPCDRELKITSSQDDEVAAGDKSASDIAETAKILTETALENATAAI